MVERDGNTSVYKSVLPCRGLIEYYYDSETTVSKVFIFVFRYSWGNAIHFFFSHLSKLGLEFLNRKCVISFLVCYFWFALPHESMFLERSLELTSNMSAIASDSMLILILIVETGEVLQGG